MADEKQLRILRQGPEAWTKWRQETAPTAIDLRFADLRGANFHGADLSRAILGRADLSGADLAQGSKLLKDARDEMKLALDLARSLRLTLHSQRTAQTAGTASRAAHTGSNGLKKLWGA
jgi:uncharacterized protein YjbI with pentapeptide repeats